MKENLVFCKAQNVNVDKSEHCPTEKCDHCSRYPIVVPSIPKKQTPKKQKQKQAAKKAEAEGVKPIDRSKENYRLWFEHLKQSKDYKEFCEWVQKKALEKQLDIIKALDPGMPETSAHWLSEGMLDYSVNVGYEETPEKYRKFIVPFRYFGNVPEASFESWWTANNHKLLPPRLHEEIKSDAELKSIPPSVELPALHLRKSQFENEGNPVYPIEAFMLAYKNGLYPPLWVMDFMYKAFEGWRKEIDKNPKAILDKFFKLTPGQGQDHPYKSLHEAGRDERLMCDVFRLTLLGKTINKASGMVHRRLDSQKHLIFGKNIIF